MKLGIGPLRGQGIPQPRSKLTHGIEWFLFWNGTLLGSYHPSQQISLLED